MELPIQRRRTPSSCSLPIDLTSEILLKLPAKSILRFRCVSKLWYSITTNPYYINSFNTRSATQPRLLLCFKQDNKLFVLSVPQDYESGNDSYASNSDSIDCYHMKFPIKVDYYHPAESVHGLICFQASIESWKGMGMILGYDHVEGKHKVVCITPYSARGEYRILTLGSAQKTWTLVKTNHSHNDRHNACIYGRCINGVVYYKIFDHMYVCSMISFDFRSEKFDMIKLPQEYKGGMLINYEGKLASASVSFNFDGGINLCILEDAKKHKWSYKYFTVLKAHLIRV